MIRQRLRFHGSPVTWVARILVALLGAALVWYGLMLVLASLKFDFVNSISGYRTAFDALADLGPDDISSQTRLIAGIAGLVAFVIFGFVAWRSLPRPYLARGDVRLAVGEKTRGVTEVAPRAVERVAEAAALELPAIGGASARYGDGELTVNVTPARARDLPETLRETRAAVRAAVGQHGLPTVPVDVVLAGLQRKQRRELQ